MAWLKSYSIESVLPMNLENILIIRSRRRPAACVEVIYDVKGVK